MSLDDGSSPGRSRGTTAGVLATELLSLRPSRPAQLALENRAVAEMMRESAEFPHLALQSLAGVALKLCRADAAGISVLEPATGGDLVRWAAVAGTWTTATSSIMPLQACPCGLVIELNALQLFKAPARFFSALQRFRPVAEEALVVPFHLRGRPLGTVWVITHSPAHSFDGEDARLLHNLARFAGPAYALKEHKRAEETSRSTRLAALNLMEDAVAARQEAERANAALRQTLEDMLQLQRVSSALIEHDNVEALYQAIVESAMALTRADMGSMQVYEPEQQRLRLLAFKGLHPHSARAWQSLPWNTSSTSGVALSGCKRIVLPDVEHPDTAIGSEYAEEFRRSGICALQSTPLISRDGRMVGTISTYWRTAHQPGEAELRWLDVLARQAADVIDRKRAHEALRRSEEQYRVLFDSMDEGYFVADVLFDEQQRPADIHYLAANPSANAMLGCNLTGRRLREIKPAYEEDWYEIFGRVARTGEPARMEQYAAMDTKWYSFYAFKVGDVNSHRVAVVFQDITARRQAEEALRANEEQFRRAIEDAPIPVIMHAEDGRVLQLSNVWTELTGYTREDIPNFDDWLIRGNEADAARVRRHIRDLFRRSTRHFGFETEVITRTGERRRWAFSASVPGTLRDGRRYIVGMALDVTDRVEELREANKELRSLSKRLVEAQETERRRIAETLHDDIGQVLTALNLVLKRGRKKAAVEEIAEAESLVADLLDRVRHLSLNLRPHVLDNLGLAAALRWHVKKFSEQTRISVPLRLRGVTRSVAPELATTVFRVIQEALTNVARHAQATQARVSVVQTAGQLQLEVCDNGRGIDPNELRTASSGIASLRERVRLSGGEFSVERNGASGTVLRVTLPLVTHPAPRALPEQ